MRTDPKSLLRPFWYTSPRWNALYFLIALVPLPVALGCTGSYRALVVAGVCVVASLASEGFRMILRRDGFFHVFEAGVQGLLIGLFLPDTFPPVTAFCLTLGTLLLARHAFGGMAASWINGAAITVIIAYFIGSQWFPPVLVTKAQVASGNASAALIAKIPLIGIDEGLTEKINSLIFRLSGTVVPRGFVTLFWDNGSSIAAFRFNILILISSAVFLAAGVLRALIPFCHLATYLVLVRLFAPLFGGGTLGTGDILLATLTGGTLITAFFLLDTPGTVPLTRRGKVIYGCASGLLGFVFCGGGGSPVGAAATVLAANLLSVCIQYGEMLSRNDTFRRVTLKRMEDYRDAAQ